MGPASVRREVGQQLNRTLRDLEVSLVHLDADTSQPEVSGGGDS
jgi:hypothetical protein